MSCLIYLLCITVAFESASAHENVFFCPHVYQMYQHCTRDGQTGSSPGTRVIRGKAGPRGIPGRNASVDYDLLNAKIVEKVRERAREIETEKNEAIQQLQNGIQRLETQMTLLLSWHRAKNGMFYKIFETKVNYVTAKRKCEEEGAILASKGIRQPEVFRYSNNSYGETFRELLELAKIAGDNTWIGLDDIQQEASWVWADGSVEMESISWQSNEPSNSNGNEDCGHFWDHLDQYLLNDAPCSSSMMYMCEKSV